jgi:WD40 repeat protein
MAELKLVEEHKGSSVVFCAHLLRSGEAVVFQKEGNEPAVVRLATQQVVAVLRGHGSDVRSIDEHPSGAYFATGCWDSKVRLFDRAGALLWTKDHADWVAVVEFSPDGALLASCSGDKTIRLWSVPDGAMVRQLNGHTDYVYAVAFSPDGQTLLSGGYDSTARVWRVATGEQMRQLDGGGGVTTVAFSFDGLWAATGCYTGDDSVRLWSTASWDLVRTLLPGSWVWGVLFTPDSRKVVVESNNISVWDVATGQKGFTVAGGTVNVGKCLSVTPLGDRLAAASNSLKTVRVFDSSSLVDVARIPVSALSRASASAWSRVPTREAERLSSTGKACLPLEVFRRMRGEARRGIEGALAGEAVEFLSVIQQRWLPRLPLGVLHRLPQAYRDTCVAFVAAGPPYRY